MHPKEKTNESALRYGEMICEQFLKPKIFKFFINATRRFS